MTPQGKEEKAKPVPEHVASLGLQGWRVQWESWIDLCHTGQEQPGLETGDQASCEKPQFTSQLWAHYPVADTVPASVGVRFLPVRLLTDINVLSLLLTQSTGELGKASAKYK